MRLIVRAVGDEAYDQVRLSWILWLNAEHQFAFVCFAMSVKVKVNMW